jgi:hypothetical protein
MSNQDYLNYLINQGIISASLREEVIEMLIGMHMPIFELLASSGAAWEC